MVWLNDLELFIKESLSLTEQYPDKTRLSYKYRAVDGKLIVKVTNDAITLKFATDQMQDLKRLEKLVKSAMYNFVQCDEEAEESQNTGSGVLQIIGEGTQSNQEAQPAQTQTQPQTKSKKSKKSKK